MTTADLLRVLEKKLREWVMEKRTGRIAIIVDMSIGGIGNAEIEVREKITKNP